jgi:hypothetical protein
MKVIELSNALVVERGAWTRQTAEEMAQAMNDMRGKDKEILVVESEHSFFHRNNLLRALDNVDVKTLQLISEYRNITVSDEEIAQAQAFRTLRDSIVERLGQQGYQFVEVPKNWNFDYDIKITSNSIRRNGYSIGIKAAKRIWETAMPIWSGAVEETSKSLSVSASSYTRTATIDKRGVAIGCQMIWRFEIEQIAIRMGWIEGPKA